jgi:hypothetical protein
MPCSGMQEATAGYAYYFTVVATAYEIVIFKCLQADVSSMGI